jgi:hypothetical protein
MALLDSSLYACFPALAKNSDWIDQFRVKFLGSVQVPYHKGNDVLCAAMQKVPTFGSMLLPGGWGSLFSASPHYWGKGYRDLEAVL